MSIPVLSFQRRDNKDSNNSQNFTTSNSSSSIVIPQSVDNISLDDFKDLVKKWMECDNFVRRARELTREKRTQRDQLSVLITQFMMKYNIEDLNTKDGRIRCKQRVVKTPLNAKVVKDRLEEYFKHDDNKRNDVIQKVYNERETTQKVGLRRLKISSV